MDSKKLMLAQQPLRYYANMSIGQRLFSARRRLGLSQQQVGEHLGRTKSAVCFWETDVYVPSIADRVDLAKLLDIPFHDLLPEIKPDDLTKVVADPTLQQLTTLWPQLEPRLRQVVLMLAVTLTEPQPPPVERQGRKLPRSTVRAAGS